MTANVKNAPAGQYFREIGYSQCYPWVLEKVSPSGKTLTLRSVRTKRDPEWTPHILPGGFCGHCDNQGSQTWLYDGLEEKTITIRKNNRGQWVTRGVRFVESDGPVYFYDYNF